MRTDQPTLESPGFICPSCEQYFPSPKPEGSFHCPACGSRSPSVLSAPISREGSFVTHLVQELSNSTFKDGNPSKNTDEKRHDASKAAHVDDADVLLSYQTPTIHFSFLQSTFFWLSPLGRLKRGLANAVRNQLQKKTKSILQQAINRIDLKHIPSNKQQPARELLRTALSFLCYRHLNDGDVDDAILTLNQLYSHDPQSTDLPLFRIAALNSILVKKQFEEKGLPILSALIEDQKAAPFFEHPILLRSFDYIYSSGGKGFLAKTLKAGCTEFKRIPKSAEIAALCECPASFMHEAEAGQWKARLNPQSFNFSKEMGRDANLVHVRIAEWQTDPHAMITFATQALECDQNSTEVCYWLIRSHLHGTADVPALSGDINLIPDAMRWKRLMLGIDLHRKRDFISVRAVLPALKQEMGKLDEQERRLLLKLAHAALKPSMGKSREEFATCSDISLDIRSLAPGLAWTTINVALGLLIVKSDYIAAVQETTKPECASAELGFELNQIAGALSDNWQLTPNAPRCLQVMRRTMLFLLAPEFQVSEVSIGKLLAELNLTRDDVWVKTVPGLECSVNGLTAILEGVINLKTPADALMEIKRNRIAPKWLRWMAFRLVLRSANDQDRTSLHVSISDLQTFNPNGAAYMVWLATYALPQPLAWVATISEQIKQAYGDTSYYKWLLLYSADRSFRSSHWKSDVFKEITAVRDVGKEIAIVIDQDVIFFSEFRAARASMEHSIQTAKARFQQLLNESRSCAWVTRDWWEPIFSYWVAVSQATSGEDHLAHDGFKALLSGPKSEEARGQLAMLAIKAGDLPAATYWLNDLFPKFPSILYAQALLAWRRGDAAMAIELLSSFDAKYGNTVGTSPDVWEHYRFACLRLLASIFEQDKRTAEAINLLKSIYNKRSSDSAAARRLIRLVCQDAYCKYVSGVSPAITAFPSDLLIQRLLDSTRWEIESPDALSCWLLWTLLSGKGAQLKEAVCFLPPWRQLLLRRLLEEGDPEQAVRLLDVGLNGSAGIALPRYFKRTQFLLLSWHFLRHAWLVASRETDKASRTDAKVAIAQDDRSDRNQFDARDLFSTRREFRRGGLLTLAKSASSEASGGTEATARPLLTNVHTSGHQEGSTFSYRIKMIAVNKGELDASFGGLTIHFLDLTSKKQLASHNIEALASEGTKVQQYAPGDLLWGFSEDRFWGQRPAKCLMIENVVQNWKAGKEINIEIRLRHTLPRLSIAVRAWSTWKRRSGSEISDGDPSWADSFGDQQGISCYYRLIEADPPKDANNGQVQLADFRSLFPRLIDPLSAKQSSLEILCQCCQALSKNDQKGDDLHDLPIRHIRMAAKFAEMVFQRDSVLLFPNDVEAKHLRPVLAIAAITKTLQLNDSSPSPAEALDIFRSEHVAFTKSQRRLGTLLTKWSLKDDAILDDFAVPDLTSDSIPISAEYLWLAKAIIMFRKGSFQSLFETEMPPKVADLSNRDACLLLSIAYARLALQLCRSGNLRGSLQHIKQAASTLAALTDERGDQKNI